MLKSWKCPYCNHNMIVSRDNSSKTIQSLNNSILGWADFAIETEVIVCPNSSCEEYSIIVHLGESGYSGEGYDQELYIHKYLEEWNVRGNISIKQYPSYIPKALLENYKEACLIKDLSPKASATLSRRCIQGIIRDSWKVKGNTLYQEIESIKDEIDPLLLHAINAVREVGNIGAHMQKDINVIIDIESDEAELLIELIETLFEETYIRNYEKKKRLEKIIKLGEEKKNQRLKGCEG